MITIEICFRRRRQLCRMKKSPFIAKRRAFSLNLPTNLMLLSFGEGKKVCVSLVEKRREKKVLQEGRKKITGKCSIADEKSLVVFCSNILRDLATIEADVNSHCEAVLNNRLSKANREKILREQRRLVLNSAGSVMASKSELSTLCSTYDLTCGTNGITSDDLVPNGPLMHAKSTGNLFSGGMKKIKQAFRYEPSNDTGGTTFRQLRGFISLEQKILFVWVRFKKEAHNSSMSPQKLILPLSRCVFLYILGFFSHCRDAFSRKKKEQFSASEKKIEPDLYIVYTSSITKKGPVVHSSGRNYFSIFYFSGYGYTILVVV